MPVAMRYVDAEEAAVLSAVPFNERFNSLPVAVAVPARTATSPVAAATSAQPAARAAPPPVAEVTAPRTSSAATAALVMAPAVTTASRLEEALRSTSNNINPATVSSLVAAGLLTSAFLYTATDVALQDAGIKTGPRLKVAAFRDAAACKCEWLPVAPAEDPALAALLCAFGLGAYRAALAEEDIDRAAFALCGETEAERFNIKESDRVAFDAAIAEAK